MDKFSVRGRGRKGIDIEAANEHIAAAAFKEQTGKVPFSVTNKESGAVFKVVETCSSPECRAAIFDSEDLIEVEGRAYHQDHAPQEN